MKVGERREQRGVESLRVSADGDPDALQGHTLRWPPLYLQCSCLQEEDALPPSPLLKEFMFHPMTLQPHDLDKSGPRAKGSQSRASLSL